MKICVIGLGFIGLPTALLFASNGHKVVGIDLDKNKVDSLNNGELPFEEPGLSELHSKAKANFIAKTDLEEADVFLIAVQTPLDNLKLADLSYVKSAAKSVSVKLKKCNIVVVESTVPPGTGEMLVPILETSGLKQEDFHLAHCPERAIPGKTIEEMVNNDRIIGGLDDESREIAKKLYSSFSKGKLHLTNLKTAEFVKLMENTYRDVNIALANEFAKIAEENRVDVWEAIELANRHPRVDVMKPGPGVGGHCIAVDPHFLTSSSTRSSLIMGSREINDSMPSYVLRLVKNLLKGEKNVTITIFGVAYKGNVDDTRESPATRFIKLAENDGFEVKVYDPHVKRYEKELLDIEDATAESSAIIIITDHDEFRKIDPKKLTMKNKLVLDTRNIIEQKLWEDAGFKVHLLGKG